MVFISPRIRKALERKAKELGIPLERMIEMHETLVQKVRPNDRVQGVKVFKR